MKRGHLWPFRPIADLMGCPGKADKEGYEDTLTSPVLLGMQLFFFSTDESLLRLIFMWNLKRAHKEAAPLTSAEQRSAARWEGCLSFITLLGRDLQQQPPQIRAHFLTRHFLISTLQHALKNVTKMAVFGEGARRLRGQVAKKREIRQGLLERAPQTSCCYKQNLCCRAWFITARAKCLCLTVSDVDSYRYDHPRETTKTLLNMKSIKYRASWDSRKTKNYTQFVPFSASITNKC